MASTREVRIVTEEESWVGQSMEDGWTANHTQHHCEKVEYTQALTLVPTQLVTYTHSVSVLVLYRCCFSFSCFRRCACLLVRPVPPVPFFFSLLVVDRLIVEGGKSDTRNSNRQDTHHTTTSGEERRKEKGKEKGLDYLRHVCWEIDVDVDHGRARCGVGWELSVGTSMV